MIALTAADGLALLDLATGPGRGRCWSRSGWTWPCSPGPGRLPQPAGKHWPAAPPAVPPEPAAPAAAPEPARRYASSWPG